MDDDARKINTARDITNQIKRKASKHIKLHSEAQYSLSKDLIPF
jgi:hypothetical protein